MSAEEKSIDLSEIQMDECSFDMSRVSILLDEKKNQQSSQTRKEIGNDTANIETRCEKKQEPPISNFMKDLQRFQKEMTFESDAYDMYHNTTSSMRRYKHKADRILEYTASRQQNKQLSEYIVDFRRQKTFKSSTAKRSAHTVKQKVGTNSPKTPKHHVPRQQKPKRHTDVCQEYYGFETPRSQQQNTLKKKRNNSSSSKQLRTSSKLLTYEALEPHRTPSKCSKGFSKTKNVTKIKKSP